MPFLKIYRFITYLMGPVLPLVLWLRKLKGKENAARISERKGKSTVKRPEGQLIWIHVASVGESLSVLPLINQILTTSPKAHMLVTSTTVTSAQLLEARLPERALHQFIPVDRPVWVKSFFHAWKPDLGLIVESELWPNLLIEAQKQRTPLILVNGRMSQRSADRWAMFKGFIGKLLGSFDLCLVQDSDQVERYKSLGATNVVNAGNLKMVDGQATTDFTQLPIDTNNRPVWLAASTHEGEEQIVIQMHQHLKKRIPDLLTILAPRHPVRTPQVQELLKQVNLNYVTRTSHKVLQDQHELFLLDTLGELPNFFSAAQVSLICGSLVPGIGGHNPVEGAWRGTAVVFGPHMSNFRVLAQDFLKAGAAQQASTANDLQQRIASLLLDVEKRQQQFANTQIFLEQHQGVLPNVMAQLKPHLKSGV